MELTVPLRERNKSPWGWVMKDTDYSRKIS